MKRLLLLFFLPITLLSQSNADSTQLELSGFALGSKKYQELGMPYMQHYGPDDYNTTRPDNQTLVQGDNGLMYIGNSKGVLEFDGVDWRLIQLPNRSLIRTLVKNEKGTIFVGGFNELGYLKPDSLGFTTFKSIRSELDSVYQDFRYLHNSYTFQNAVFFQSRNHLFRWSDNRFKIWSPEQGIVYSAVANGSLYVQDNEKDLYKLEGNQLQFITSFDHYISSILAFDSNKTLVATRQNGLFLLKQDKIIPFRVPVEAYLKKSHIVNCKRIPNGWITIGTGNGGLVVIDKEGALVNLFDKTKGLLNNSVLAQELDNQGGLWLGLNYGISRIELLSPYSIFDGRMGVHGFVNTITRHRGHVFAGSIEGLLKLKTGQGPTNRGFEEVQGVGSTFYLSEINQELFIATTKGTFNYHKGEIEKLDERRAGALLHSKKDSTVIYLGLFDGLAGLKKENGIWKPLGKIKDIDDDIRELVELDDGKLWMESQIDGVWLVDFYKDGTFDWENPEIKRFLANKELPPGWLFLHSIKGEALFEIGGTIYRYNQDRDSIMPDTSFGEPFGFKGDIVPKLEDKNGNLWMLGQFTETEAEEKQRIVSIPRADGSYEVIHINDDRITHGVKKALYPDGMDVLWYGGPDGIIRQDLKQSVPRIEDFETLVRKISVNADSAIYGGSGKFDETLLDFKSNTLRFEYAAPNYNEISRNRYQYYLEGYDENWSDWTEETRKDYTQIPEGNYTFRVKAKNIYEQVSAEGRYPFAILPPWYRSWWAYGLYFLLFAAFLYTLLQWRSRQLKRKNEALEKLIAVRTSEVQHQANQLKIQAEKLLELDQAKSRFFANISHEFRTPLTLIKGPIEQLEQNFHEKLSMENVKMIRRNANRVLSMVNQLLDLSKIDEGSLKLAPTEGDVYKCLRAATSSFNSHAAQRNIDYRVQIPQAVLWASFDRDKLENIIYNLLSNAFKFSGDGSEIAFNVSYGEGGLQILVSDSGKGIPKEKIPFIFDRFYQVDSSTTKEKEGSGIGLSLSRDLVELMDGTVTVASEPNKGTIFTVQLPLEEIRTGQRKKAEDDTTAYLGRPQHKNPFVLTKVDKRNLPTILLVEDNIDMRSFITEQLVQFYKIKEAKDGKAGLKKAITDPPDLVITDLMMPKMDGIELCKKLKTDVNTSHIPVIMLTAKAGMDNKLEGLETGADDYLTKPFDAKELLVRTKNLIEQRQKLRELYTNTEIQVDPKKVTVTSIDQKFLEQVLDLLEENYPNSDFGVPQMQKALAMSKTQLHRKLKALTNEAPGELLRNFRLKRAAQLLSQKADSVTQIAYQVGFNNLSYFAKCFKELYGVAPSTY
ncbi:ATP-binding protein [Flavobacteriaceae bacterium 3-367]